MVSEAQHIQEEAQYLIDNPLLDRDEIDRTLIRIRNRAQVYISAEQDEDDDYWVQRSRDLNPRRGNPTLLSEPGLSGHEMAAFEAQKFNDTLGEDPGIAI